VFIESTFSAGTVLCGRVEVISGADPNEKKNATVDEKPNVGTKTVDQFPMRRVQLRALSRVLAIALDASISVLSLVDLIAEYATFSGMSRHPYAWLIKLLCRSCERIAADAGP
jgi:hypothetical protein